MVPKYGHYVAYAHPPGRVHRAMPFDQNRQATFRLRRKRRYHREESGGQPMTRIALALALALALSSAAAAQTTTFRDPAGRVTGKARTNAEGTTTFYDAAGRVTGKATAPRR